MFARFSRPFFLLMLSLIVSTTTFAEKFERPTDSQDLNEAIVHTAYDNLMDYTGTSAPTFHLEISDFRHLYPNDFSKTLWSEIVSPPEGLLVDMQREVQRNTRLGQARSEYQPSLRFATNPPTPESNRLLSLNIEEVLAEVVAADPESNLANVSGMTAFQVKVTLAESTRTYRAAFVWVPTLAKSKESTALVVLDHVTQGVEEAARDPFIPLRNKSFLLENRPSGPVNKSTGFDLDQCLATSTTTSLTYSDEDSEDHFTGKHSSTATFDITCSCDSSCTNSCVPQIRNKTCSDSGVPITMCHKMQGVGQVAADLKHIQGSSCAAGYICAQKACLFCTCGLTIGVQASVGNPDISSFGPSVEFSSVGNDWSTNFDLTRQCPPCEMLNGGDGGSGPTGGGGNGGGGEGDGDGDDWGGGDGGSGLDGGDGSDDGPGGGGGGPEGGDDGPGGNDGGPGDGGGDGGGGGGGGGGGSFPVYCNGEYVGQATTIDQAWDMCGEGEEDDDGLGGGDDVIT